MLVDQQEVRLGQIVEPWPASKPDFKPEPSAWFGRFHEQVFANLLQTKPKGIYVELGTWTGAGSTRFVSRAFPNMTVICVDTFAGSPEHMRDPKQKLIAGNLWNIFCVNRWEERSRIFPIKKPSVLGLKALADIQVIPDFVYIDAAHDADSVFADVQAALTLFPTAVVFGDDYVQPGKGHTGVYDALERAKAQQLIQRKELLSVNRVWYLTRNLAWKR
jgi:predicted O-methyltransferase YrrM